MTFINDIWASIQIFISNYTYYYGMYTNIALAAAIILFVVVGVIKTYRLPKGTRKRIEIKLDPPKDVVQKAADSLSEAVKIETLTGDRKEMERLIEFLKSRYKTVFEKCSVTVTPSKSLVIKVKGDGTSDKKPALFCCHMDVVPAMGEWRYPAFSGLDDGSNIWGRGTIDSKGNLIAQMEALESSLKAGFVPKRDLYFAYGSDDETGGEKGAGRIKDMFEKNGISFDFVMIEGGSVTSSHLEKKSFSVARVAIGAKGTINIKMTAKAEGGHSAAPAKQTAIGVLSEAICRLEGAPMRRRLLPSVKRYLVQSSPAFGFFKRFCIANSGIMRLPLYWAFSSDKITSSLFRTTFAVTQIKGSEAANMLPTEAVAVMNIRVLQGDTDQSVLEHIRSVLIDLPVDVELLSYTAPSEISDTKAESYELLRKTIENHFGTVTVLPCIMNHSTDAVHYEKLSDNIYRFLPFVMTEKQIDSIHGVDERIRKDSLGSAVEFYRALFASM